MVLVNHIITWKLVFNYKKYTGRFYSSHSIELLWILYDN